MMTERPLTKKKILLVFGTRPEAIKMAPLVAEFRKHPEFFDTLVCVTAQHREMLDQVLELFDIVPDHDLNIMHEGQDLTDVTSRVLIGMRDVLEQLKPDLVLVHGDTTTSTTTALAAFYKQIPVGHIEAGLRTYNVYSPWPEEMNRQITGRIAFWHFAPTILARQNLLSENVPDNQIIVTGNTVIDAMLSGLSIIENRHGVYEEIISDLVAFGLPHERVTQWNGLGSERKMILITGHRRENFGEGIVNICEAIRELSEQFTMVDFVYPMHLNPNVRKPIHEIFGHEIKSPNNNVFFIEPLQYLPFLFLMGKCVLVLTDSGGIQEEAPGLGKPVLVMRDNTERPEALQAGTVKLVGTNKKTIIDEVTTLLTQRDAYNTMAQALNPYGDGKACERIVQKLIQSFE
ncbi:MAG TPA: UDP-N-acetylglucosamine 2-epimerase (non-hydrolyzing) [Bacteroidales bacterium]|nr:UDP-N-acetylglucosamine 2-epimerase (non-hydrolyzing) [Bacteroidales bacterium]